MKKLLSFLLIFSIALLPLLGSLAEEVEIETEPADEIVFEEEENLSDSMDDAVPEYDDTLEDEGEEEFIEDGEGAYDEPSMANTYTINGVAVYATMVSDPGSGQCWEYANRIYNIIWGRRFTSTFVGDAGSGHNLLRNLNDSDRTLTPEHLKNFVSAAVTGAVLRIGGCTSSCSHWNDDGLACGHSGHSLIIVAKSDSGFTTFERLSGSGRVEKTWTWDSFCRFYASYPNIKYIKWPGAGEYISTAIQLWGIEENSEWNGKAKLWAKRSDNDPNHYAIFYIDDSPITGHLSSDDNGFFSVEVDTTSYLDGYHQLSIYYANTISGNWDVRHIVFRNTILFQNIENGAVWHGTVTVRAKRFNNDNNHYAVFYLDDVPITGHVSSDTDRMITTIVNSSNYVNGNHQLSIYYACTDYGGWDVRQIIIDTKLNLNLYKRGILWYNGIGDEK